MSKTKTIFLSLVLKWVLSTPGRISASIMRSGWASLILIPIALTPLLPTSILYNPQYAEINGTEVSVYRTYPMHEILGWSKPIITYTETVWRADGVLPPCIDTATFRHNNPSSFGVWDIEPWASDCIDSDYLWHAEWQAYLFGVIPLRPVSLNVAVFTTARNRN